MPHAHMPHIGRSAEHSPVGRRAVLLTGAATAAGVLVASSRASSATAATTGAGDVPQVDTAPCSSTVVDTDAPDLDAALASVPDGGELVVTRRWERAAPLEVARPVTVRFTGEGHLAARGDFSVVRVTASHASVVDAVVSGTGGRRAGAGRGIDVVGTHDAPLDDVRISGGRLSDLSHDGVRAEHVSGLVVQGVAVADVAYAGVLLRSCEDSVVRACRVTDVHQPSPYVNSYGVIVTRDDTVSTSVAARSARVVVEGCTVVGVRLWEGLDTHAGDRVVIRDNVVRDCRVGIAVVPCRDELDRSYRHAPLGFVVADNVVERIDLATPGAGILVKGAGTSVGDAAERATGFVTGNTVRGHGGGTEGGIVLYLTRDVVVSRTALEGCVDRGVLAYHSNDALTVTRTTVSGLVPSTPGGAVSAVEARSGANTVTVSATTVSRVPGAPGPVRGVAVASPDNLVDLLANDWRETDLPVWNKGAVVRRWADDA